MKFIDKLALRLDRKGENVEEAVQSRRVWMQNFALVSATGGVLWACGSKDKDDDATAETASEDPVADGKLLNAALALEHEAISLYTQAAGLPFMAGTSALAIAGAFLEHHKEHRTALESTIASMKTKNAAVEAAVATKANGDYLSAELAAKLTDVKQVLRLAALKESGAAQAYLGLISSFTSKTLAQTSGMLGGDEAGHYGVLRAALLVVAGDTLITTANVIPASLPSGWKDKDPAVGA